MKINLLSIVALLALHTPLFSQTGTITGNVLFEIEDYAPPVQKVVLYNSNGDIVAEDYTDPKTGAYTFDDILTGTYTVVKPIIDEFATINLGDFEEDGDPQDGIFKYEDEEPIQVVLKDGEVDAGNNFYGLELARVLPVEFIDIEATAIANNVKIFWSTASEINNDVFEIERSNDGYYFETVGTVNGNGTTNKTNNYQFSDINVSGKAHYRIKQIDYDGKSSFSNIVSVSITSAPEIEIYPTNVNNSLTVNGLNQNVVFEIFNTNGQRIKKGTTTRNIDMSTINHGIFIVRITDLNGKILATEKVFK